MQVSASLASPCNRGCVMDTVTHFCKGCFRTIEEIIRWQFLTPEEKAKILRLVEERKISFKKNQKPS